jgi:flavin reductase (DIM6/NTAB) family NADH-FMN oxidoreductase RutF
MMKTEKIEKFYYYYPQAVVLVGVAGNLMPAAWHTPISARPPLFGVLISPKRYTLDLLKKEDGFTINFVEHDMAAIIAKLGGISGREVDKLRRFEIEHAPGQRTSGAILAACYAAYECRKISMTEYGDHYLVVGEIVLIHYQEERLNRDGMPEVAKVKPVLYFGQDRYLTIDPKTLDIHKRM